MATAGGGDDFTFPTSGDRSFIGSPPLWRRVEPTSTSAASSSEETEQGRSFSYVDGGIGGRRRSAGIDGGDGMDSLWEDLNDDPTPQNQTQFAGKTDELLEFGCVPAVFNLSRAVAGGGAGGGRVAVANSKKVRLVALAKVFKRLFLLRRQHLRKCSW